MNSTPSGGTRGMPRVLVVDDSAVAREILSSVLKHAGCEVTTASNASSAANRIAQQTPDVLLLDLEMPGMNGLEFLERQMAAQPIPIVICSGIAQPGAAAAIRALELGAVDVLPKPALGVRALADGGGAHLVNVVRAAAQVKLPERRGAVSTPVRTPAVKAAVPRQRAASMEPWLGRVLLIGASTGGTDAIRTILTSVPPNTPPMVIVQHMPREYTGAFARRLNEQSAIEVREAEDGDALAPGVALIAPGGRQTELVRVGPVTRVRVFDGPPVSGHRPSVDALFHSATRAIGARAVAALLTGMGADGANGLLALRKSGAHTIAQDEATSVVFGMPKEAIALGAAGQVLPLDRVAAEMLAASV